MDWRSSWEKSWEISQFLCKILIIWAFLLNFTSFIFIINRKEAKFQMNKRFPANTKLKKEEKTFLSDKKVDGELYAFLQANSFPNEKKETIVEKRNLPTQAKICEILGCKSPKTYRAHLQYLIQQGYVEEREKVYYLPNVEEIYFMIPLDTLKFLNDTLKEQVIKIYIYLGQRFKYKQDYVFTIEEIAQHIGIALGNNKRNYDIINNCLVCLRNNGLITYAEFYENEKPRKRLVNFSFNYKTT